MHVKDVRFRQNMRGFAQFYSVIIMIIFSRHSNNISYFPFGLSKKKNNKKTHITLHCKTPLFFVRPVFVVGRLLGPLFRPLSPHPSSPFPPSRGENFLLFSLARGAVFRPNGAGRSGWPLDHFPVHRSPRFVLSAIPHSP